jgi:PLP dependent protein
MGDVRENILKILSEIPKDIIVVAAAKSKTVQDVEDAIAAGIHVVGENYLQESRTVIEAIGNRVTWHFIGHVQKNKVKNIVPLFDMIETVDSLELAALIDQQARKLEKVMPVLIEVNSAHEEQKHGAMPEDVPGLIREIGKLPNIRVKGLMTMGPFLDDPAGLRPYFRQTKQLFDEIKSLHLTNVEMENLSMGMSDSYLIAIEEGATMVRIGTKIFGPRSYA